jgi:DNA-binding IclR family transcriptional regulator
VIHHFKVDHIRYKTLIDFGRILTVFEDSQGEERSVGYIAKSLKILPSKVSRMLKTLDSIGLFEKNHETGYYRIGARYLQVGLLYTLNHPVRRVVLPHLEQMSSKLGLVASWAIFRNNRIIVVDRLGAGTTVNTVGVPLLGLGPALHSSSHGKLFLAYLDPEELEEVLQSLNLSKFTSQTITDLKTIREELGRVRERGYSIDLRETFEDIQSMSAPIIDAKGNFVASIAIGSHKVRFSVEEFLGFATYLTESALFISRQLGYIPWGHDAR